MNKVVVLLTSISICAGCSGGTAALTACSAAIPPGATATKGPLGSSACTDGSAVAVAAAGDLAVAGFVTVGPAMTFSGSGPFPHGIDFVLPYTASKVPPAVESQVVVLLERGHAPAHAAMVTNIVVEGGQARVHFHAPDVATFQLALPEG